MRKIYKKLSQEQRARGVIFTSTLSKYREEMMGDTTHEVLHGSEDVPGHIARLKDDKFFNDSPWKYNIIRT